MLLNALIQLGTFFSVHTLEFLSDLAFVFNAMSLFIVFYKWRALNGNQKIVAYIVVLTFVNHGLTWLMMLFVVNNLWVYHVFAPALFCLMAILYGKLLNGFIHDRVFQMLIVIFVLSAVLNTIFLQPINELNSNMVRALGVLSVGFSIIYFYRLIKEQADASIRNPMVWFNLGVLMYYSGTLILFFVIDSVVAKEDTDILIASWTMNAMFNLVLIISYAVAIWLKPRT